MVQKLRYWSGLDRVEKRLREPVHRKARASQRSKVRRSWAVFEGVANA